MFKKNNVVSPESSVTERIVSWIIRRRVVLSIVFAIVIVGGISAGIAVTVVNSKNAARSDKFVPIREAYNQAKESDEKDYTSVLESLNSFIGNRSDYVDLEALYIRANILFEQKDFAGAYDDYDKIDSRTTATGLFKDIAIYSKAVCKEQLGQDDEAYGLYQKVWDDFGLSSPLSAQSLFALFRYSDKRGNKEDQIKWAKLIKENYPYSDYTKIVEPYIPNETTPSDGEESAASSTDMSEQS